MAMIDPSILDEAAAWHERIASGGPSRAFDDWLGTSDAHAAAFNQVAATNGLVRRLASDPALLALRQETLARTMLARPRRTRAAFILPVLGLAALTPLAAFGLHSWQVQHGVQAVPVLYRTGIGQQAEATLADGSVVTLDTASRLEVRFDGTERRAVLLGQGWFKIAPGASPFRIEAGGRNLSAKGGEFDVRTDPGNVRAYAAAGRLMLDNGDNPVVVDAGRLMEIRDGAAMVRSVQDPAPLTGWRAGLLQFRDAPVGEVAGELNRYRRHPIEMADGRVAAMRISGTFRTAEGSAFPDALASGFPVRVSTGSDERVVVASR